MQGDLFLAEEILGSQYILDALMPVLTHLQFFQFLCCSFHHVINFENIASLMTILSYIVFSVKKYLRNGSFFHRKMVYFSVETNVAGMS